MAVSYNEDIKLGGSVFHVQTEYYKKSGKVVSNIFKDGLSIKRLEKDVEDGVDIDSEVAQFHKYVVERLRGGAKKKISREGRERRVLSISDSVKDELLRVLNPYFGVATSFVIEEALSSSSDIEEFLNNLLEGLPEEIKGVLYERLIPVFSSASVTASSREEKGETETEEFTEEKKEKAVSILSEYFGIMALPVLEEALEEWKSGDYSELVELIVSHLEDEKEREELSHRLMFL